jgi:putative transposase
MLFGGRAFRYELVKPRDAELMGLFIALARYYSGLGYVMLYGMLKAKHLVVNRKHTHRIYAEEKF